MPSLYEIALTLVPGVGVVSARNLLSRFGEPEQVFKAKAELLMTVPGIGPKTAASILSKDCLLKAENELKFVEKYKIKMLFCTSPEYPQRLKNCYDHPVLLYYKGSADLNSRRVVSIVGTRNATSYGRDLTCQLVEDLKAYDVLVVSGLAYGIDVVSHRECVKQGIATVGVVGHGLDRIYPAQHRPLAESMIKYGGVLSEFPSGTNPDRENFPKRNRIVAGLADVTIVVEAAINGGALITADLANSYDRDVFAFPGRINDPYSEGCNHLIKTNRANLVSSIKDIEYLTGWDRIEEPPIMPDAGIQYELSGQEEKVYLTLKAGQLSVDALSASIKVPSAELAAVLLSLEMKGLICAMPGNIYRIQTGQH